MEQDWRDLLTENVTKWKLERSASAFEKRSKERLLIVAQTGGLRAGKYKSAKLGDPNEGAKDDLIKRLAQLEYGIETLDAMIADGEAELSSSEHSEATPDVA